MRIKDEMGPLKNVARDLYGLERMLGGWDGWIYAVQQIRELFEGVEGTKRQKEKRLMTLTPWASLA